ncbi:MAG: hypothetical protein IJW03_03480 [Clostridia bacterium]|nr:hypothetical protein [Clostridia bacterium]
MKGGEIWLFLIEIDRISEEEFMVLKKSTPTLCSGEYRYSRDYFLIKIDKENKWLIDQVDVGLPNVPYMMCNKSNILFVATTFNLYVIDCINNKIVFECELKTPCVDFFATEKIVYIICECQLLHFSIKDKRVLKCDDFSDMLEDYIKTDDKVIITLENGQTFAIK